MKKIAYLECEITLFAMRKFEFLCFFQRNEKLFVEFDLILDKLTATSFNSRAIKSANNSVDILTKI